MYFQTDWQNIHCLQMKIWQKACSWSMCLFQGLLHSFIAKFLLCVDLQKEDDDTKSEIEKHLKVFKRHCLINQPEKAELPRMQKQYNVFFFLHVMIKNKKVVQKVANRKFIVSYWCKSNHPWIHNEISKICISLWVSCSL